MLDVVAAVRRGELGGNVLDRRGRRVEAPASVGQHPHPLSEAPLTCCLPLCASHLAAEIDKTLKKVAEGVSLQSSRRGRVVHQRVGTDRSRFMPGRDLRVGTVSRVARDTS